MVSVMLSSGNYGGKSEWFPLIRNSLLLAEHLRPQGCLDMYFWRTSNGRERCESRGMQGRNKSRCLTYFQIKIFAESNFHFLALNIKMWIYPRKPYKARLFMPAPFFINIPLFTLHLSSILSPTLLLLFHLLILFYFPFFPFAPDLYGLSTLFTRICSV